MPAMHFEPFGLQEDLIHDIVTIKTSNLICEGTHLLLLSPVLVLLLQLSAVVAILVILVSNDLFLGFLPASEQLKYNKHFGMRLHKKP